MIDTHAFSLGHPALSPPLPPSLLDQERRRDVYEDVPAHPAPLRDLGQVGLHLHAVGAQATGRTAAELSYEL